jgi:hypothetical protein
MAKRLLKCEWDLFKAQRQECKKDCWTCKVPDSCKTLYSKVKYLRDKPDGEYDPHIGYIKVPEWKAYCNYLEVCYSSHGSCKGCGDKPACDRLFDRIENLCNGYSKESSHIVYKDRTCDITRLNIKEFVGTGEWR